MKILGLTIPISVVDSLPLSSEKRFDLPENVACKATIDDFLELNEICEYKIEYHQGYIISFYIGFMLVHEEIIPMFTTQLMVQIEDRSLAWRVFGSNLEIYIHNFEQPSFYKPDSSVFKQTPKEITFINPKDGKQRKAYSNPHAVFEVLSPSTRNFDLTSKLENYKKLDSLAQIIFAEQDQICVYVHEKIGDVWIKTTYSDLNDVFFVADCAVSVQKLYKNVKI